MPKQVLMVRSTSSVPFFLKPATFLIASLLLMCFPLRVYVFARTAQATYTIRKVFGERPRNLPEGHVAINLLDRVTSSEGSLQTIPFMSTDSITKNHLRHLSASGKATVLFNPVVGRYNSEELTVWCERRFHWQQNRQHNHRNLADDDDEEMLSLDIRFGQQEGDSVVSNLHISDRNSSGTLALHYTPTH